jgi:hypothetical protein
MWTILFGWTIIGFAVGMFISGGFGVMSMNPPQYTLAQVFFSLSMILIISRTGWWLAFEKARSEGWQASLFCFVVFGGAGVLWYFAVSWVQVLRPVVADLAVNAYVQPPWDYPEGTMIKQIRWIKGFTDLRVDVVNSKAEVHDLDFTVKLDVPIAAMDQVSDFPGVNVFPVSSLGVEGMWLFGTDQDGKAASFPIVPTPGFRLAGAYRVHCDKVLSGTTMKLIIASAMPNPESSGSMFISRKPKSINIEGTYRLESDTAPHRLKYDYKFQ